MDEKLTVTPEGLLPCRKINDSYAERELFCVAASDLSALIQVPYENIGILYGSIMRTGTLKKHAK
ncbi:hypothetical protein OEA41_003283 [Lepraria neglecta]|uniref:Uncharacterized protein n=1 Tax=Lepraria neglecta TaxID=209136 RepID=A0AAD9Z498_9LECA|nr:hypothetical protein OEA41_003283 [Lepraria neglecta]